MKQKIREWMERYLLAEVLSTTLSLGSAWLINRITRDTVLAAFVGSGVASVSFYGIVALGDVKKRIRHHRRHQLGYGMMIFIKDFRNLIIEFGPAEILDVLAVRPFFMYLIPKITGTYVLGVFLGKMIADLFFFVPAIIMYEVRKKHLND